MAEDRAACNWGEPLIQPKMSAWLRTKGQGYSFELCSPPPFGLAGAKPSSQRFAITSQNEPTRPLTVNGPSGFALVV